MDSARRQDHAATPEGTGQASTKLELTVPAVPDCPNARWGMRGSPALLLGEIAARYGSTAGAVLAEMHAADFLQLGPGGDIHVACPFSAAPASHVVRIAGGPQVHAMCAIGALGIAAMPGADARIISADPRGRSSAIPRSCRSPRAR
jgi:hypothetical protein